MKICLSFFIFILYNTSIFVIKAEFLLGSDMRMKRIMAIDYGDARTGVAVSDLLCSIVGSTTVVRSRDTQKAIADIVTIAKQNDVEKIVVGLPKNMDGTEGSRASLCREFARQLEAASGLPV